MDTTVESQPAASDVDWRSLLSADEIPVKLRCTICNQLAVDAVKLPCCDQSICELCRVQLSPTCPVCEHSPVSAEDCKLNKSLRTTIRIYLKTAQKKKSLAEEKEKAKENARAEERETAKEKALADEREKEKAHRLVVVEPAAVAVDQRKGYDQSVQDEPEAIDSSAHTGGVDGVSRLLLRDPANARDRASNSSVIVPAADLHTHEDPKLELDQSTALTPSASSPPESEDGYTPRDSPNIVVGEGDQHAGTQAHPPDMYRRSNDGQGYGPGPGPGQAFDPAAFAQAGNLPTIPSVGWNGLLPMMQPAANPMTAGQWNMMSTMMALPSMPMDPMTLSQGMLGGFGGPQMGMPGMNGMPGMGMAAVAGQGGFGGWNGQAGWNSGLGGSDPSGDHGAGYAHHLHHQPAGYNVPNTHGNYNLMPFDQHQYPSNHGFHGRYVAPSGFGRGGRGGRHGFNFGQARGGRGGTGGSGGYGYGYGYGGAGAGAREPRYHELPSRLPPPTTLEAPSDHGGAHGNPSRTDARPPTPATRPAGADDSGPAAAAGADVGKDPEGGDARNGLDQPATEEKDDAATAGLEAVVGSDGAVTAGQEAVVGSDAAAPGISGPGEVEGAGDLPKPTTSAAEPADDVHADHPAEGAINAPLGPAARGRGFARRALPRGSMGYRAAGRGGAGHYGVEGSQGPDRRGSYHQESPAPAASVRVEPRGQGVVGAPTAPKALREGLPNTGIRGYRGGLGRASIAGTATAGDRRRSRSARGGRRDARSRSRSRLRSRSRSRSPDGRRLRHYRPRSRSRSRPDDSDRERRRAHRRLRDGRREPSAGGDRDGGERAYRRRDRSRPRSPAPPPDSRRRSGSRSGMRDRPPRRRHDPERDRDGDRARERGADGSRSRRTTLSGRAPSRGRRHRRRRSYSAVSFRSPHRHDDDGGSGAGRGAHPEPHGRRPESGGRPPAPTQAQKRARRDRSGSVGAGAGHPDRRPTRRAPAGRERPAALAVLLPAEPTGHDLTREREARDRERLAKEQQRRQDLTRKGMTTAAEPKLVDHHHDDDDHDDDHDREPDDGPAAGGDDRLSKRRRRHRARQNRGFRIKDAAAAATTADLSRRISFRYEGDEPDEVRARRVAREMEAARWD